MSAVGVLKAGGILRPEDVVSIAAAARLELAAAATLLVKESSGGHHVWGHDPVVVAPNTYVRGGPVTESNYTAYRTAVKAGVAGRQGCGPTQLTFGPFQERADDAGGCWNWKINCRVGFEILADHIRRHGVQDGFRAYNGSGPAAQAYGRDAKAKYDAWRLELEEDDRHTIARTVAPVTIIPRTEWGARHGDGFAPAPLPASEVWLHHSVTVAPDLVPPFDDELAAMRTLENIGQARFGGGISYTWAVMPSGRIYQGHSVGRRGAHTKGRNSIARAVVLVGNYENQLTTGAQREAVANLLRHAEQQGWITQAKLDGGHRNAPGAATACPGRNGMAAVVEINRLAVSEEDDMPSVDEIWGHSVRNLNGDTVRVDQVVVATEARVAELQKEMDELKKLVNELHGGADD